MRDFRELKVWEKGHQLALAVYRAAGLFPREELYGLSSQVRRSCTSIPSNIAEGCGRGSDADFARFLQIAMGSASELEYLFLLSHDLGYLPPEQYGPLADGVVEIKRMLTSLIQKIHAES